VTEINGGSKMGEVKVIESKKAVLSHIGRSQFFHGNWEKLQEAQDRVLNEAFRQDGNMNEWIDACNEVKHQMDMLQALGWSVRHGDTVE
jgi:hypothetical protein